VIASSIVGKHHAVLPSQRAKPLRLGCELHVGIGDFHQLCPCRLLSFRSKRGEAQRLIAFCGLDEVADSPAVGSPLVTCRGGIKVTFWLP